MNIAVRYYTKTGNTKKLADAIADELGVKAKSIEKPLDCKVDVLFLCNSVYWAGIDSKVKRFVKDNAKNIETMVNVGTAALIESTYGQMKSVAADAGVNLSPSEFHCRGQFKAIHPGYPREKDLEEARRFARETCARVQKACAVA